MRRFGYRGTGTLSLNLPNPVDVQLIVKADGVEPKERLYLASNLNGWNPRNDRFALRRMRDGRYELRQMMAPGTHFEFKLTRGGWDRVEVRSNGMELPNRHYRIHDPLTIEIEVEDWQDHHPLAPKPKTTVGDVRSLGEFRIPSLDRKREVLIYLPPGYEEDTSRHYPVMYMFDGQNLFDESTAFTHEWGVDETCERLIRSGELPPMIVVAIYNGEVHRLSEQSPWPCALYDIHGEGDAFLDWIVGDLKRRIDRGFRTLPDRYSTGIGGSSMGGLTALYAGFRHADTFGKVLAMSPSFWFAQRRIFQYVEDRPKPEGSRFYLDVGHHEGTRRSESYVVRHAREMVHHLGHIGFQDGMDLRFVEDPHGHHSEADWARRLPRAFQYLWGS